MMKKIMKGALSILLAMVLCIGSATMLAPTVLAADADELDDHSLLHSSFDVSNNLILYSSFDESNANDESGNGHNGTAVGNVQYVDGVSGKGVHLTNTYVDYGNSSAIIPDTGDFSFSVFFRSAGTTHESCLLGNKNYNSARNTGFVFVARDDVTTSHNQRLNIGLGGTAYRMYCWDSGIVNNEWHHLVCTIDRDGSMAYYVDGVRIVTTAISSHKNSTMNAGLSLQLGADGAGQYRMGDGYLDELCVYNKAFTADEVESLYNSTAPGRLVAKSGLNKMLKSVQETTPGLLFPQDDIDNMLEMIQNALAQLDTLSDEQCRTLLDNCKAAYEIFLQGKKPLASFHWISDVHVPKYNDGYAQALKNMGGINADTNIGLIITGDNTNGGSVDQIETFYALTKENSPVSAANTGIILGNHDVRIGSPWYNTPGELINNPGIKSEWQTVKDRYMKYNAEYMNGSDTVYHAKKIGGYTFIMLNTELDLKDGAYISLEQLDWLEETLAAAYAEDPSKPVFIALHQPLYDTHNISNDWGTVYMLNEDGTAMSEDESNSKFKAVLAKYPTSIFLSGHLHNSFSYIRGVVRPFGAAMETPAFKDGGYGYEVQIYSDCVVFRAINYVTGEYAPAYDVTIQIGENNVSQIYQNAKKVLADADQYGATAIANIQALYDTLNRLITVSYQNNMSNFYTATQHTEINATAQSLKKALNDLRGNVSSGDTVTVFAGETLQLTVADATAWQSGDASIVSVDANGKLTALKKGETSITITTANGTVICNVKVAVDTSAIADAIYAANTLKTNVVTAEFDCGAGIGELFVPSAAMQALTEAVSAAQAAMAAATTEAEATNAAKAMNDALDTFRYAIKVGVAHEGEFECSTKCKYGCGTDVDAVSCVGKVACRDNVCKYCGKAVTPLAHKGKFECSNICQYGCGTAVEPKEHEGENEDSVLCKYGCGTLVGDPTASLVTADGVTTHYASLEEAVAAATSGSTVMLLRDIGSEEKPLALTGNWLNISATNVTLDGGNHTIIANSTGNGVNGAMIISRDLSNGFVLKNITIHVTYPESASDTTPIINSGGAVAKTIENCKLYTNKLGVYGCYQRGDITMINTEIHAGYNAYMSSDNGQRSYKVTFTNCKLYSKNAPAIQARIEPQLILNNTVVQGGNGIDITLTQSSSYGTTLTIKGNTTFTNGNVAIQVTKNSDKVIFDTTAVPFTGKQIIRESGNNYYFYDTLAAAFEAGATKEELYTYSAETAEAIKAQCYTVSKVSGAYTVTGIGHEGEFECSNKCKNCNTAITPKKSHEGEFECSNECKYGCGTAITPEKSHEGEFECSNECKYGCGTAITDAKTCVGEVACVDMTCQWCGRTVTPIEHDIVIDASKAPTCTEAGLREGSHCSRCNTVIIEQRTVDAKGHKYDNDSDTTCNVCGTERTVENGATSNENTANGNENDAQSSNTEAPENKGLSGGAIAGIVIATATVLGGGGFALSWFVIKKKKI